MSGGVMVDMGWPWWVSSILAAAVAAVAVVAFLLVRNPFVRGVAATLVVQAVFAAIVAPFLMPSGGSSPGMSRSSSDPAMSRQMEQGTMLGDDGLTSGGSTEPPPGAAPPPAPPP